MGIGRRNFLKLTSLAITGLVIDPFQSVITTDDVYINKKLGILFHKLRNWGFINVKDFGKLEADQIFEDGLEKLKDTDWVDFGAPICLITKYPQDNKSSIGLFSPTIAIYIAPASEFEVLRHQSLEEFTQMTEFGTGQFLKDYRVLNRSQKYLLSNTEFCEFDAEYLFEHVEFLEPFRTEVKIMVARHGNYYYTFSCHQAITQGQVADREFAEFRNTIKFI